MQDYYIKTINTEQQNAIVNEVTDLLYGNSDKEDVRKIISSVVGSLIGGFNAYKDIDEYLDNEKRKTYKYWEEARKIVFSHGNAGWSMCVKELLDLLTENIKSE